MSLDETPDPDLPPDPVGQSRLVLQAALLDEMAAADTEARLAASAVDEAPVLSEARRFVSNISFPRIQEAKLTMCLQVVVEKLTKNVNEDHLRDIFGIYGQIRDLDMPMNRQCTYHTSPLSNSNLFTSANNGMA
jgi:hypothetical protein